MGARLRGGGAGYTADAVFAPYVVNSAGGAAAYGWAGEVAALRDPRWVQRRALTTRGATFPLVAVGGHALPPSLALATVGALFVLVGVTWAVIAVTATGLVSRLATPTRRGEALGGVGGGVGSAFGGVAATAVGYPATFVAAGALVVAAALLVR